MELNNKEISLNDQSLTNQIRNILGFIALIVTLLSCQLTNDINIESTNGEILFQDDFSNNTGNWYTYVDSDGTTDFTENGFRIYINEPSAYHWTNPNQVFHDTIIEVEATKLDGPEENDFGIICRYHDENNFYFFTISSDGYYGIAKIVEGVEKLIGMEELEADESAIKPGKSTNLVRADCIGSSLKLYANGRKLIEVSDTNFESGDIGLIASTYDSSGTDILFNNLVVRKP